MNDCIKKITTHASVRDFENIPLSSEVREALLTAARSASSSHFVQAFSILEITDKSLREELAGITESASYVKNTGTFYVFIADLYRQSRLLTEHDKKLDGLTNMESLIVSIVDTSIAAQNMALAAESMDLGICYIGGIRNDVRKVSQLLKLPKYTLPLFGLTIGVPASKNKVKPRLLERNQSSENYYPQEQFTDLKEYEKVSKEYYSSRESNQKQTSWSESNVAFFEEIRRPEIAGFLREQGFQLN
ncbi:oxygen-insensitive NADPH nitroreductase [Listeria monocytogenes]|nr:oxygen-insensitive NADPH nitroreductase [Listeria monocytogenes]EAC3953026.1 oxygen-insensitive NADPH nitroreductase [Listeria monocytogenes]EAC9555234.1 oxygen-insensitive NADPH nitroreductase [Listeria monocytogenes]EAD0532574.1 oxygen-insensitive NADPH nitroreductase [Listeria monocytogenes]EAE1964030.1 oxygen-insensitive NADPH nitroreductase [Listeria monocytogenes]